MIPCIVDPGLYIMQNLCAVRGPRGLFLKISHTDFYYNTRLLTLHFPCCQMICITFAHCTHTHCKGRITWCGKWLWNREYVIETINQRYSALFGITISYFWRILYSAVVFCTVWFHPKTAYAQNTMTGIHNRILYLRSS